MFNYFSLLINPGRPRVEWRHRGFRRIMCCVVWLAAPLPGRAATGWAESHPPLNVEVQATNPAESAGADSISTGHTDTLTTSPLPAEANDKKKTRFTGRSEKGRAADSRALPDTVQATPALSDAPAGEIKVAKPPYRHQLRLGFDLARVAFNLMFPSRRGFEIQADYALRKNDLYLAAEAGHGRGNIDYSFLQYTSQSTFLRLGIEKSFLDKVGDQDFDIGFLGFRYGIAGGSYSDVNFLVEGPFGGTAIGTEPGSNFVVHWGEIVGGIKVEVWHGIFVGWTARGKFLFNPGQFRTISPNYIAGYGKGDRTSVFDFSFYLSYALRWTK